MTGPAAATVAPAHPWRRTARTALAVIPAVAIALPSIVDASGVDDSLPAVGVLLATAGGLTRVLALPQVEQLLRRFAPWLSASDVQSDEVFVRQTPTGALQAGDAHPSPTGQPLEQAVAERARDAHGRFAAPDVPPAR